MNLLVQEAKPGDRVAPPALRRQPGAYDHRPGRKVEPERREQAGGVAEDADAIGLEIASVPLIKGREGGHHQRDETRKRPTSCTETVTAQAKRT